MKTIKSPLDGYLKYWHVAEGDSVQKGQIVAVVCILKMENPIPCDYDGVVAKILVKKKANVKRGQPLLTLE